MADFSIENGVLTGFRGRGPDVTIPANVTKIAGNVFLKRIDLERVTLPAGLTEIGDRAFMGCGSLREISLPAGLTRIGPEAFCGCSGLERVVLPEGLTEIGYFAFFDCWRLRELRIPESLRTVGRTAFGRGTYALRSDNWREDVCEALESCVVEQLFVRDFSKVPADFRLTAILTFLRDGARDPDGPLAAQIDRYILSHGSILRKEAARCPELLHYICERALIRPNQFDRYVEEIEACGDPELLSHLLSVQQTIGMDRILAARERKQALREQKEERTFLSSMEHYDRLQAGFAAENGPAGVCFLIPALPEGWSSMEELRSFLDSCGAQITDVFSEKVDCVVAVGKSRHALRARAARHGTPVLSGEEFAYETGRWLRNVEELRIPPWVKTILPDALPQSDAVKRLTLPPTVTEICPEAFRGCAALEFADLSAGSLRIGAGAFRDCAALREVRLPENLPEIGKAVFQDCAALARITLPKSLTIIRSDAFRGCRSLGTLALPEGLRVVCSAAFRDCRGLRELTLPESLTEIGQEAFRDCQSLISLVLPGSLRELSARAFYHCARLETVELREGISVIGDEVFCSCWALRRIQLPASVIRIRWDAFRMCPKRVIHAPPGSKAWNYAKQYQIPCVPSEGSAPADSDAPEP